VTPGRLLGKDHPAVHRHLEDPARGLQQLDLGLRMFTPELRRQTGGAGLVVSNDAVFDTDLHAVVSGKMAGPVAAQRTEPGGT
jgi:hypothetical protein